MLSYITPLSQARLSSICGMSPFPRCTLYLGVRISAQWRFVHFHGQKTARLDRCKSIYKGDGHKRTMLVWLSSPCLFFLPDVHLRELAKVWADEVIIEEVWKNFMEKLISEWLEFVLYVGAVLSRDP